MQQLCRIHPNAQPLNNVGFDFVEVRQRRKGLRTDHATRWLVGHTQHDMPTALIGQRNAVAQKLGGVVLLLGLFEFEVFMLGRSDQPAGKSGEINHGRNEDINAMVPP